MQVKEVMNSSVSIVNQEKTIIEASRMMRESNCGSIPVEEGDRLVGMITDRDITIRVVAEGRNPSKEQVKNCMTKNIKYCFDTDNLEEVGQLMSQNRLRRLPVLNKNKRLVGIVSIGDFARSGDDETLVHDTLNNVCH